MYIYIYTHTGIYMTYIYSFSDIMITKYFSIIPGKAVISSLCSCNHLETRIILGNKIIIL